LAVHDPHGWRRRPANPDYIAYRLRSFGASQRQRAQHEAEREAY
jgi:hypothetical protein